MLNIQKINYTQFSVNLINTIIINTLTQLINIIEIFQHRTSAKSKKI